MPQQLWTGVVQSHLIFVNFDTPPYYLLKCTPKSGQTGDKLLLVKIGHNIALSMLKSTPGKKKVHHRRLWRLWQIWAMLMTTMITPNLLMMTIIMPITIGNSLNTTLMIWLIRNSFFAEKFGLYRQLGGIPPLRKSKNPIVNPFLVQNLYEARSINCAWGEAPSNP